MIILNATLVIGILNSICHSTLEARLQAGSGPFRLMAINGVSTLRFHCRSKNATEQLSEYRQHQSPGAMAKVVGTLNPHCRAIRGGAAERGERYAGAPQCSCATP